MGEGGEQLNLKKNKNTFTVGTVAQTLQDPQPGGTGAHTAMPAAGRHRGAHCGAHCWEAKAEGSLLVHEINLHEMVSSRPPQCWVVCGREAGRRTCTLSHQNRL